MWFEEPPLYLQVIGQIRTNEQIYEEFLLFFGGRENSSADFTRSTRKCGVLPADAQSVSHGQVGNVGHTTRQLCGFGSHLGAQDGFEGQREVRFWGDEVRKWKIIGIWVRLWNSTATWTFILFLNKQQNKKTLNAALS